MSLHESAAGGTWAGWGRGRIWYNDLMLEDAGGTAAIAPAAAPTAVDVHGVVVVVVHPSFSRRRGWRGESAGRHVIEAHVVERLDADAVVVVVIAAVVLLRRSLSDVDGEGLFLRLAAVAGHVVGVLRIAVIVIAVAAVVDDVVAVVRSRGWGRGGRGRRNAVILVRSMLQLKIHRYFLGKNEGKSGYFAMISRIAIVVVVVHVMQVTIFLLRIGKTTPGIGFRNWFRRSDN